MKKLINFTPLEKSNGNTSNEKETLKSSFWNSLTGFIKYNNAFTIIVALVIFGGASSFASETVRDNVIGETIVSKSGVDNSRILGADVDNFNMDFRIDDVKETEGSYIVSYSFQSIGIKDDKWQDVLRKEELNVSKERLSDMDLGAYVAKELGELAGFERKKMKEVQTIEKAKGVKKQTVAVAYTGLKGLIFNDKTDVIEGYSEKKADDAPQLVGNFNPNPFASSNAKKDEEPKVIINQQIVKQALPTNEIESVVRQLVEEKIARLEKLAAESGNDEGLSQNDNAGATSTATTSASNLASTSSGGGNTTSTSTESQTSLASSTTPSTSSEQATATTTQSAATSSLPSIVATSTPSGQTAATSTPSTSSEQATTTPSQSTDQTATSTPPLDEQQIEEETTEPAETVPAEEETMQEEQVQEESADTESPTPPADTNDTEPAASETNTESGTETATTTSEL